MEYPKAKYNDLDSLNRKVGSGILDDTINIRAADSKKWVVGPPLGFEVRPSIRLYTETNSNYQFVEINMFLAGLWQYLNQTQTKPTSDQTQTVWYETELPHSIISTFKTKE
jgi:hypothetical protein